MGYCQGRLNQQSGYVSGYVFSGGKWKTSRTKTDAEFKEESPNLIAQKISLWVE